MRQFSSHATNVGTKSLNNMRREALRLITTMPPQNTDHDKELILKQAARAGHPTSSTPDLYTRFNSLFAMYLRHGWDSALRSHCVAIDTASARVPGGGGRHHDNEQ